MADKDNTTSTPLYELRGQKISSLTEATNVSSLDDAYLLLSIKDDNVAINKKISLTQLLRVLIGDDNVATQIKNLYDNFRVGTTSPEYMNIELVKQIFPEIYIELQPNISEKPETESEYLNNIRTMRTAFNEENALNELNEIVSEDGGLVTSKLLKYYMSKHYDVIMHRIDLIEGLFDDTLAIDTLREIIDWFVGYTNNEANLTALITRIEERIESTAADTLQSAKNFTIDEINKLDSILNAGTDNGKQKFITGITQDNGKITQIATSTLQQSDIEGLEQAISDAQYAAGKNMTITQGSTKKQINCALEGGSNITIDESTHKINCEIGIGGTSETFTVDGVKYALQFENGKFSIAKITNPYSSFTFTEQSGTSSSGEFEYNNADGTITIIGKPNKKCKITTLTNVSGSNIALNTEINANANVEVSGNYSTNENKTFKIGATMSVVENDGGFTPVEKSITKTVNFNKYKIFCFTSSSTIDNISIHETDNQPDVIGTNNVNTKLVKSLPANPLFTFTTASAGYLYLLIPTDTRTGKPNWKPTKPIKWTGTESIGDTPEGNDRVKQISLYNNSINYTLYRSYLSYPQNTNISLKIE